MGGEEGRIVSKSSGMFALEDGRFCRISCLISLHAEMKLVDVVERFHFIFPCSDEFGEIQEISGEDSSTE